MTGASGGATNGFVGAAGFALGAFVLALAVLADGWPMMPRQ